MRLATGATRGRTDRDLCVLRKLGVPGHEELAIGAIASGGGRVLNENVIRAAGISQETIERIAKREQEELEGRELEYWEGLCATKLHFSPFWHI